LKRNEPVEVIDRLVPRPARGAWIETVSAEYFVAVAPAAPRAGRVD